MNFIKLPKGSILILEEEYVDKCVEKCANILNKKFRDCENEVLLVCVLKGATYFYVDLSRKLEFIHSCYFMEASLYKNCQVQSENVEILTHIDPSKFFGKKIILVDELYDTGHTLTNIKQHILTHANVPVDDILTCTAFQKVKKNIIGTTGTIGTIGTMGVPDVCGMVLPDVWLIGYGLDDKQYFRNLKCLYACPKTDNVQKTEDDKIFDDPEMYNKYRKCLKNNF